MGVQLNLSPAYFSPSHRHEQWRVKIAPPSPIWSLPAPIRRDEACGSVRKLPFPPRCAGLWRAFLTSFPARTQKAWEFPSPRVCARRLRRSLGWRPQPVDAADQPSHRLLPWVRLPARGAGEDSSASSFRARWSHWCTTFSVTLLRRAIWRTGRIPCSSSCRAVWRISR